MANYLISSAAETAINNLIKQHSTNIRQAAVSCAAGGTRGAMNYVRIVAAGLEKELGNPADLQKVHARVAEDMRAAVKNSFEQTVKSHPGSYRAGENRLSGGMLKRAVMSSSLAIGTAEGIDYVDADRLDEEAAHWRRLNFGAYGTEVAGRKTEVFQFRFDDIVLFSVGFKDRPRPAFSMPPGRFFNAEGDLVAHSSSRFTGSGVSRTGMDRFYPGGGRGNKVPITRGITARNFLDAGLERMVRDLPIAYTTLVDSWLDDAVTSAKLPPKVNVRVGLGRNSLGQITQANP